MFPTNSEQSFNYNPPIYTEHFHLFNDIFNDQIRLRSVTTRNTHWFLDSSFIMMVCALLFKNSNNYINFEFKKQVYSNTEIDDFKNSDLVPNFLAKENFNNNNCPTIKLIYISRGMAFFNYLDSIKELEDIKIISSNIQMNRFHRIRIYNRGENNIICITSGYTWEVLRKLIALFPIFFPNFPMTPLVKELLKLFGVGNYSKWLEAYTIWFNNLELHKEKIKEIFNKVFNSNREEKINTMNNQTNTINLRIEEKLRNLGDLYRQHEELQKVIIAYETLPVQNLEAFYNYITNHKFVKHIKTHNDKLIINFVCPLIYYDIDVLKTFYNNPTNDIHQYQFSSKLFEEVFIKQKYIIYTETVLMFGKNQNTVTRADHTYLTRSAPAHPHIMILNCFGGNATYITEALAKEDYILAFEQIISSLCNINFLDVSAFKQLCQLIELNFSRTQPFIEEVSTKTLFSIEEITAQIWKNETEV